MTPSEAQQVLKIARIFRCARKHLGLTQVDICQELGVSQSTLSKIEAAKLMPSASQWIDFCSLAGISPSTALKTGYIDHGLPAKLSRAGESNFRIPKKYREFRGSKARAVLPFLIFFEQNYGEEKLQDFLKSKKMDGDFFFNLDAQINIQFTKDIIEQILKDKKIKINNLHKITQLSGEKRVHGKMHSLYDKNQNEKKLISTFIQNLKKYDCNFNYKLVDQSESQSYVSVLPAEHMEQFNYAKDQDFKTFINKYRESYWSDFFKTYSHQKPLLVSQPQDNLYLIKVSA